MIAGLVSPHERSTNYDHFSGFKGIVTDAASFEEVNHLVPSVH